MSSLNIVRLYNVFADYTLWPLWVDSHVTLPFSKNGYECFLLNYLLLFYMLQSLLFCFYYFLSYLAKKACHY